MQRLRTHSDNFEDNEIKHLRLNRMLQKKDEEMVEVFKKFEEVRTKGAS